ncbi:MAG: AMP-dependent synthetase and ligase [Acidobacteriaceae bacterium]|nr:AMP-dependent synthetase and ligase [Acidobacteriaceae bacterium]
MRSTTVDNGNRKQTQSAHVDTFCAESLPPKDLWPELIFSDIPGCDTERINIATELLDKNLAAGNGERVAYYHASGNCSYRELFERANQIAHVLVQDFGLVPGNRVLLRGPNHPMLVACWFGVIKTGGVVVCTNPLLRTRELGHIADKAQIKIAISDHRVAADCERAMQITGTGSAREGAVMIRFGGSEADSLESMMSTKPRTFSNCDTAADDVAVIAFTSGTTGRSKGTMHFHRDLLAATECFPRHVVKPQPEDIFCGTPPLAFTYSLGALLLFPMRVGAATLLLEQTTPAHLLHGIQQYRATVCFTAPTAYRGMLKVLEDYDSSSLKKCISAGEPLPAATSDAWHKATGLRIIDGIGSTEMLHIFVSAAGDEVRPGATGKQIPGYQTKVIDESGNEVPIGTVGRLAVRGPTGCRYLDNIECQKAYVENGWNITGDSYRMDEDGYFWFQARTDDMIISSGYNISGLEVENVLLGHQSVAECAVIGVPDEERGQIVKAFVVLAPGVQPSDALAKQLQDFVKKEIAPYKYPRSLEFISVLPKTNTGKIQRFRLREGAGVTNNTSPEFIVPEGWQRPKGYAHGMTARGTSIFVAGQIGWNPLTEQFETDDFADQVAQALRNAVAVLKQAGAEPSHVTRLTWYITDKKAYMDRRREIGRRYRDIFGKHFPAMSVVVVSALIEDRAKVEIEATAVLPD